MSLSSGSYTIRSAAFNEPYIGRNPVEDRSLNPKRIISLPDKDQHPTWRIEKLPGDSYYLRAHNAATAILDGLVFAILLDNPPPEEWHLEKVPQHGENQYLITAGNNTLGWVLPNDETFTQIAARPLIVLPSEPPLYPSNERWIIESLNDLD